MPFSTSRLAERLTRHTRHSCFIYPELPCCGKSSNHRPPVAATRSNICPRVSYRHRRSPLPVPIRIQNFLVEPSPKFYRRRARPSKARKLLSHMLLNRQASSDTLSAGAAINPILGICGCNPCDISGFDPLDPGLIPGLNPGSYQDSNCFTLRHERRR